LEISRAVICYRPLGNVPRARAAIRAVNHSELGATGERFAKSAFARRPFAVDSPH
jgi:hypothetical protein